jgi:hypothetical protein
MKIRTDFVSNSSSCSFVIQENKVNNSIQLLEYFHDCIIPNEINAIGVIISSNGIQMKNLLESLELQNDYKYTWDLIVKNNFDTHTNFGIDMYLNDLIKYSHKNIDLLKNNINKISFWCHDYEDSILIYLIQLFNFFDINKCHPIPQYDDHNYFTDTEKCYKFLQLLNTEIDTARR